jgi:hypothetical protein
VGTIKIRLSLGHASIQTTERYFRGANTTTPAEKIYCARGDWTENRIKEQQLDLFADRTSTGKMWSNQLRLYFSSIAYVLLQTLRRWPWRAPCWRKRNAEPSG